MVEIKEEDIEYEERDFEVVDQDYDDRIGYEHILKFRWLNSKKEADQLKQQILQDHEDAKRYREDFQGLTGKDIAQWQQIQIQGITDRRIVKRLEERIEELKKLIEFYQPVKTPYCESRLEELQKILDGNEGKRD